MRILFHKTEVANQLGMEHLLLSVSNLERAELALADHNHLTALRRLKYAVTDLLILASEVTIDQQWLVASASDHVSSATDLARHADWNGAHGHVDFALNALAKLT